MQEKKYAVSCTARVLLFLLKCLAGYIFESSYKKLISVTVEGNFMEIGFSALYWIIFLPLIDKTWFILIGSYLQEEEIKVSAGKKEGRSVKTFFKTHNQKNPHKTEKQVWRPFTEYIHYLLHKCKKLKIITKVFDFNVFPLFGENYCVDITFVTILNVNSMDTVSIRNKQAASDLRYISAGRYFCMYALYQYAWVFTQAGRMHLHLGLRTLACLGMVEMQITVYRMLISNTDGLKFQKQQL